MSIVMSKSSPLVQIAEIMHKGKNVRVQATPYNRSTKGYLNMDRTFDPGQLDIARDFARDIRDRDRNAEIKVSAA